MVEFVEREVLASEKVFEVDSVFVDHLDDEQSRTDILVVSLVADELGLLGFVVDVHESFVLLAADEVHVIVVAEETVLPTLFYIHVPHRVHVLLNHTILQLLTSH